MNMQYSGLSSPAIQEIYSFTSCTINGTHANNNFFRIGSTVVRKRFIVAAGNFAVFVHVMFDNGRQYFIVSIGSFFLLEKYIRVLSRAPQARGIRSKPAIAESLNCIHINQSCYIFVVIDFNFLNLMRGAEAVKKM